MRFWWVNHKQTYKQEVGDGYLWSPKTKKGGIRNPHYDSTAPVLRTAPAGQRFQLLREEAGWLNLSFGGQGVPPLIPHRGRSDYDE